MLRFIILGVVICIAMSFKTFSMPNFIKKGITSSLIAAPLLILPAISNAEFRLPPIDQRIPKDERCVLSSSTIGQANAARDKLFDLRECNLQGQEGAGKDMSGMIAIDAVFDGVNFKEGQISKGYIKKSSFKKCDFTNGVIDRVAFEDSELEGAIFKNAVLSGTTFTGSNLKDTDFTDAYLGPFDLKNLCGNPSLQGTNPTTGVDTRESAGCRID